MSDPFELSPEQQAYRDRHPALFDDGARLALLGEAKGAREKGNYPLGFHQLPLEATKQLVVRLQPGPLRQGRAAMTDNVLPYLTPEERLKFLAAVEANKEAPTLCWSTAFEQRAAFERGRDIVRGIFHSKLSRGDMEIRAAAVIRRTRDPSRAARARRCRRRPSRSARLARRHGRQRPVSRLAAADRPASRLARQNQELHAMTDAFDRASFIGAEQLELRPEAQVLVFADRAARDAAVDVFPDHVCISVVGAVDQAEWTQLHGRRVIACGDENFCDRVADFAEIARFSARVMGPGEDPKNARDPAPFGDRLVRRTRIHAEAPFEPLILERLVDMPPADYERLRARLRADAGFTRLGALDEAVKQARNARDVPEQGESQIDKLLAFTTQWECFASPHEKPFVSFVVTRPDGGAHIETLGVRSRKLRLSLVHKYFLAHGRAPGDAALRVVADTLEARALYSGSVQPVFIRHGWHDGVLYLDRGTEDRSAYRVSAGDWRAWDIIPSSAVPVKFIRVPGMLPLPEAVYCDPKEGLVKLREVTRFQTERDEIVCRRLYSAQHGRQGSRTRSCHHRRTRLRQNCASCWSLGASWTHALFSRERRSAPSATSTLPGRRALSWF